MKVTMTEVLYDSCKYRFVGEPETEDWKASLKPGREPYCEVNIDNRGVVRSYGGEVWPSAWPSLFQIGQPSIYGVETKLTPKGAALLLEC